MAQSGMSSASEFANGLNDLRFFGTHSIGTERIGRFHCGESQQLEDVIRNHVAHGASFFVEAAALFHADGFGDGNLHMIDTIAIPDGLKHAIGKAEHQKILHGFFAKEVINPVDLRFFQDIQNLLIERSGRGQIMAEWFFNHNSPPDTFVFVGQAGFADLFDG